MLLTGGGATSPAHLVLLIVAAACTASIYAATLSYDGPFSDYRLGVHLWSGVPPGDNAVASSMAIGEPYQARIINPVLVPYPCEDPPPTGCTSVVILPGGGFMGITVPDMAPGETEAAARRFQALGFTALLLYYRSPAPTYGVQPPPSWPPLLDARRALILAHANAAKWHIDVHRLGVLGFSSGGALAALLSFGRWTSLEGKALDVKSDQSLLYPPTPTMSPSSELTASDDGLDAADPESRPAFALLLYPSGFNSSEFISNWHMHTLDSHGQLGPLQPSVRPPPTFVGVAQDDDVVGVDGSVALWEALHQRSSAAGADEWSERGDNHALHVFSRGGHGFGVCLAPRGDGGGDEVAVSTTCPPPAGCPGIDACNWVALARAWLREIGMQTS